VGLAKFNFAIATTSVGVSAINMYGYTDAAYSTPISGVGTGGLVNTATVATNGPGTAFTIYPTASTIGAIEVPAGQTYYFEVRATVAGIGTSYNAATTLLGDATFAGMSATTTLAANNFIWSPNATTTSVTTVTDWTDGAAIVGLPSSGLVQNRTN
jgi:hypothetical protein